MNRTVRSAAEYSEVHEHIELSAVAHGFTGRAQ